MSRKLIPNSPEERLPHERFHGFLLNAIRGCALLLLDTDGLVVRSNSDVRDITGYAEDEISGMRYANLFLQSDQQSQIPVQGLKNALKHGFYEAEGWLQRKDGSLLWATLSVSPAHDDAGDVYGYAVMIRDVSEKRAAERALFNSEQQFRLLVEGVRDYAIYMLDPDGHVTNWNAGAALIKGYTADEIIGQHFSVFYTEDDKVLGEPARGLEAALRYNTFQNEAWRVRKDGTHFWASVVIDPIYDECGRLIGYAKITRDITDKKRSQEKNERQRDALHQSQKLEALGRLTGSVAHDFNNMLAVIRTAAEMLGSGMRLAHDNAHYIKMITDASERAARLTDQLLSFARRQPLRYEVFSPITRIKGMVHVLETTLGSRVELIVDLAGDLANVESDVSQFDTAILNLVINARDAMAGGGTVTISARNVRQALEDDADIRDWVAIEVRDIGSGIHPATLPNIFEPFFTTKPVDKGTGLGLSQVYGFVKQSGGDVKVESTLLKGTIFTLYLPMAKAEVGGSWSGLITAGAEKDLSEGIRLPNE